ncbi:Alpha-glutamyl/putrescinyl thymine pyrophosphorylase clade 3 [compost metagenome]
MLEWLEQNYQEFAHRGYRFGNHRKYETMNPAKRSFTGLVLRSYVNWVISSQSHVGLFRRAVEHNDGNPRLAFRQLYKSMSAVFRFGRTGRFDYLTMIAKVGIADIEADSTYMGNATGPYDGANLLFLGQVNGDTPRKTLDNWIVELDEELNVGMQVLEDALCNWQKSPRDYIQFRG